MTKFLNLVVGGSIAGGLYALFACGVVLTYQASGIFNFAHGAVAFATAYLFAQLHVSAGLPVVPSAIISIGIFAPALGLLLDRALFRRLKGASLPVRLVVPIGLLIAVPGFCLFMTDRLNLWFNLDIETVDQLFPVPGLGPTPKTTWNVNHVLIDSNQVAVFATAVLVGVAMRFLLRSTRLGLEMRAVVDRRGLAGLRGINADRTSSIAWMLGSLLAGLTGVLLAPLFTLRPATFTTVVLISTVAVVMARFRSLPWAFAGGLLIGISQNLFHGYGSFADDFPAAHQAAPYVVLLVLLLLLDRTQTARGGTPADNAVPSDFANTASWIRRGSVWAVAVAALLIYSLWIANGFWQVIIARGLALGIVMLSFTVVTGLGGMVSLAQASFVTAAAFAAGWALARDAPFLVALLVGTLAAASLGLVIALPARRVGGLALALSSMALAFIGQHVLFQTESVSKATEGGWLVPAPKIGPLDLSDRRVMIVSLLAVLGLVAALVTNLIRSSSGRAMAALRCSEAGAVSLGVSSTRTKIRVFVVSAAIAGFGGVLLATTSGRVTNVDFPVETGLFWLSSVVVFGVRRPAGAVLAGLSAAVTPQLVSYITPVTSFPSVLTGLAALTLAQNPDGILALNAQQAAAVRQRLRAARTSMRSRGETREPLAPDVVTASETAASTYTSERTTTPADVTPLLDLERVHAGYGDTDVLHGVDLVVHPGETVALVGSNGAGKSTLCAVGAGLVRVSAGRVVFDGVDVTAIAPHRRVAIGLFVIPEGRGIFPNLDVEDNLALWLRTNDTRAAAYDRFPVLAARRRQLAGSLSGGEQQMLALAPALVHPPRLVVADEPSLGLAPLIVDEVYSALQELKAAGTALLLVEEKPREVFALADRIAFMQVGHVLWTQPADAVNEDLLVASYLGIDPSQLNTRSVIASTRGLEPDSAPRG